MEDATAGRSGIVLNCKVKIETCKLQIEFRQRQTKAHAAMKFNQRDTVGRIQQMICESFNFQFALFNF